MRANNESRSYESTRAERVFDFGVAALRVLLVAGGITAVAMYGSGEGDESDLPQEEYTLPDGGVWATPVAVTPETQAGFVMPDLSADDNPAQTHEE